MTTMLDQIVAHKKTEIKNLPLIEPQNFPTRSFKQAIQGKEKISLIAEIKKQSPSNPKIFQGTEFNPAEIAKAYKKGGAKAISVLTDEKFFNGSYQNLIEAKKATNLPILAKDFFISKEQIDLAKNAGADAILLIVKILTEQELNDLYHYAKSKNLDVLTEITNEEDLKKALTVNVDIIGINNRNLDDFSVNLTKTYQLAKKIPEDKVIISLSGFRGADIRLFKSVIDSVLVGTEIMQAKNIEQKIKDFTSPRSLLKICGIRTKESAKYAEKIGIDLVGLNFVSSSKRYITKEQAQKIRPYLKNTFTVGVFQNQPLDFVNQLAEELNLDFVQLHDEEDIDYCKKINKPIIKSIGIKEQKDLEKIAFYEQVADILLFDGSQAGSGEIFPHELLKNIKIKKPFFIAGGVNAENAQDIIKNLNPDGLDTASGIEENNQISLNKIDQLFNLIQSS